MSAFWRPVADRNAPDNGKVLVNNRHKHLPLSHQKQLLPILAYKSQILYCVEKYAVTVLVGETGCGKSTQIPQYLYEAGWTRYGKGIVCTQPRRVAAMTVASRVADEMGTVLGDGVGYAVRFDYKLSAATKIKYCTDGVLLRETLADPLLNNYSIIMVDEAHERSLQTDILMGLLKKIMRKRSDLRVIVASATLNAAEFKQFFEKNRHTSSPEHDTACILPVTGRVHPIDVEYLLSPTEHYVRKAVDTVLGIHKHEEDGDILVFLPGGEDIDRAIELLESQYTHQDMYALALYSSLPVNVQMMVFEPTPPGKRKVVFATNIAETSITIDGIRYVVDSGFVKLNYFDVRSGVDALICGPVSKAQANQRAGRAGRVRPGKCFRLMTEDSYASLVVATSPEMQRVDVSWAVLQLKALGIDDVLHFDFISPPPADSMIYALELLYSLGALSQQCALTELGASMAEMPIEPRLAKCLLSSYDFGCGEEALTIAAMCAVEYPFITMRAKANQEAKQRLLDCISEFVSLQGDHITLLNVYNEFQQSNYDSRWCNSMCLQYKILCRAREVRKNLQILLEKYAPEGYVICSAGEDVVAVKKCLISGYFSNAAQLASTGAYFTVRGRVPVNVYSTSVFARFGTPPEWVIFNDITHTDKVYIREVTGIDPNWLVELAGHYYMVAGGKKR